MVKTKRRNIVYRKHRTNKTRGGTKEHYKQHYALAATAKEAAREKQGKELENSKKEFKKLPYSVEVREADNNYQRAGPKLGFGFGGKVYKLLAKNKKELPKRLPIELKSNLDKNMYITKIHEVDKNYKRSSTSSRNRFNLKLDFYYGFTKDHKVNVQKNVFMQFKASHPSVEDCFKRLVTKPHTGQSRSNHPSKSKKKSHLQTTRKHISSPTISKEDYEFFKQFNRNLSPGTQKLVDKYEKKHKFGKSDPHLFDVRTPEDDKKYDATPQSADLDILQKEAFYNLKHNQRRSTHSKQNTQRRKKHTLKFSPSAKSGN